MTAYHCWICGRAHDGEVSRRFCTVSCRLIALARKRLGLKVRL